MVVCSGGLIWFCFMLFAHPPCLLHFLLFCLICFWFGVFFFFFFCFFDLIRFVLLFVFNLVCFWVLFGFVLQVVGQFFMPFIIRGGRKNRFT